MGERRAYPWGRLALTVLAPLVVVVIGRWPLPGRHLEVLEREPAFDPSTFGIFSFGLNPAISAFMLVEVAALIVPRWRPLRHGGPDGRARLGRRIRPLTLVLVSIQSFFVYRWMRGAARIPGMDFTPETTFGWVVVIAGPIAGLFVLLWLAELISRYGLGNGMSVLIAWMAIPEIAVPLVSSARSHLANGDRILGPLTLIGMVVVALALSAARYPARGWREHPPRPELPMPISALVPLTVCASLLTLSGRPAIIDSGALKAFAAWLAPGSAADAAVRFPLLALLGVAFAWLFARPSLVAPVWRRSPEMLVAPEEADVLARAAYRRGLWQALAFVGALAFADWLDTREGLAVNVYSLVIVVCAALDVATELHFRGAHADVAAVTVEHRLYAVGPMLAVLAAAGIAAFPRALRHRALLAFWGPYLPIEILVPQSRAAEARALLAPWLPPASTPPDPGVEPQPPALQS